MTTARTFLRFALAGLFVNVLAAACVVDSGDDDDDDNTPCTAGTYKDCTCSDGSSSQRKCNASGSGYAACVCDGSSVGGSGSGGSGSDEAGAGNTTAGMPSTTYGGESNTGGVPAVTGGAPAVDGGAPAAIAGAGGAGGAGGNVEPLECQDPADDCEACYFSCCDDWVACFNDPTCLDQFNDILVCSNENEFVVDDLKACADEVGAAGGPWSDGLDPKTVTMINCLGGDPASTGWADQPSWGADSCNNLCFNVE